jgi:hypothetical protein
VAGKLDSPRDEDCVELAKHLLSGCQASLLHFLSTRLFMIIYMAFSNTKTKYTWFGSLLDPGQVIFLFFAPCLTTCYLLPFCKFTNTRICKFVKQFCLVPYCRSCCYFHSCWCLLPCRCGLSCYCFHLDVACWWRHICCLSHCCCLHPCYCWHSCCFWHPFSY